MTTASSAAVSTVASRRRLSFPSLAWFEALAARMAAEPGKYRRIGVVDVTLVPAIRMPDGSLDLYALEFESYAVKRVSAPSSPAEITGRHAVLLEGDLAAWREMIESIEKNGEADLTHTLNYLTLPDWPLRLSPLEQGEGQLDVDRFYRFMDSLQELFNEAAAFQTEFPAPAR
jgi:hypothetical protein